MAGSFDTEYGALFSLYMAEERPGCGDIEKRLETNAGLLKQGLDDGQRRLLLRICDDKDLICERRGRYFYARGFRRALMLAAECFWGDPGFSKE